MNRVSSSSLNRVLFPSLTGVIFTDQAGGKPGGFLFKDTKEERYNTNHDSDHRQDNCCPLHLKPFFMFPVGFLLVAFTKDLFRSDMTGDPGVQSLNDFDKVVTRRVAKVVVTFLGFFGIRKRRPLCHR